MRSAIRQILFSTQTFDIGDLSPTFSIDAARSAITFNGSTVAQINGLYGTSNASQSTATNQPTYLSSEFNGYPCLSFDGSNDQLDISVPQANGQEIYVVVDTINLSSTERILLNRDNVNAPALYLGSGFITAYPAIFWQDYYPIYNTENTRRKCIIRYLIDSTVQIQIDGKNIYSAATPKTFVSTWTSICLSSVQQAQILLKELHILPSAKLTDDIRNKIFADLANRSGLTASLPDTNPYKFMSRIPK